jgi:hypothetical protein
MVDPRRPHLPSETRVMRAVSWIFLAMGIGALLLFLRDPSIHRQPQLALLLTTGLVGSAMLRWFARLLGGREDV